MLTIREERVINAFINCVTSGQFTYDYACTLIEDSQRYGYLSDAAKETFYAAVEAAQSASAVDAGAEVIEEAELVE